MPEIKMVDGTLREGEQSPGVYFTRQEKIQIATELDRIGVPILDVGMPSVSAEEREGIHAIAHLGLKASIGASIRLKKEEVDQAAECNVREVFLICPVSSLHIHSKLQMDESELKKAARESIEYARSKGLIVNLVAEDASRAEVPFLVKMLSQAHTWGAQRAFICDTVGIMEPSKTKEWIHTLRKQTPSKMELGIHCHNDFGLATANTLAAIEAGVNYPAVTVNGIGERAGNAPLHEILMILEKLFHRKHGIDLEQFYSLSRLVEQCSGIFIPPHAPVIGLNAFRHESGIHVDGILKNPQMYEAINPKEIGRNSEFVLGKHTGTQTIRFLLQQRGYEAKEEELKEILQKVKERKAAKGKAEIVRMVKEIGGYYEQALDFPMEIFWDIVKEVLKKNG